MADPDFEIKRGEGEGGGRGGVIPQKIFWSENKGGLGAPGPSPGSATA